TELAQDDASGIVHVPTTPALEYHGRISDWVAEVARGRERGDTVLFVAATSGRAERIIEILSDYDVRARSVDADDVERAGLLVATGRLSRGFHLPGGNLMVFAETDLFEEERTRERRRSA